MTCRPWRRSRPRYGASRSSSPMRCPCTTSSGRSRRRPRPCSEASPRRWCGTTRTAPSSWRRATSGTSPGGIGRRAGAPLPSSSRWSSKGVSGGRSAPAPHGSPAAARHRGAAGAVRRSGGGGHRHRPEQGQARGVACPRRRHRRRDPPPGPARRPRQRPAAARPYDRHPQARPGGGRWPTGTPQPSSTRRSATRNARRPTCGTSCAASCRPPSARAAWPPGSSPSSTT